MSEPKQNPKKSGGGKKQQEKKKTAKSRHPNPNGAIQAAKNAKRRKATETKRATALMKRLLARHTAGKPGGIKEGSVRHKRLAAHIKALSHGLPTTQQKMGSHRDRLLAAGTKVGYKLVKLIESGALKLGREARKMLQYALALFAKAHDNVRDPKSATARLLDSYVRAGVNGSKVANPPAYEKRDFRVPKSLPAPKRDRKALMAKQRGRLVREMDNLAADLASEAGRDNQMDTDNCRIHLMLNRRVDDLTRRIAG